jgi:tRNA dimethylallyltransferase
MQEISNIDGKPSSITILGPTASGKTHLAVALAHQIGGEIISADSRQVYKGMNIGTGKDLSEYSFNNTLIPYHLIDVVEAGSDYHIYQFQQDVALALTDIHNRKKIPIVCGGTGLYINALLQGYLFTGIPVDNVFRQLLDAKTNDELKAIFHQHRTSFSAIADISTRKRLIRAIEINQYLQVNPTIKIPNIKPLQSVVFGLDLPVEVRRQRITQRLYKRLQEGMIEEVEHLLAKGIAAEKLVFYGLEYKFITEYLQKTLDYDEMVEKLNIAIHQFAKRQMTFFRKMERDGVHIHWLNALAPTEELLEVIKAQS